MVECVAIKILPDNRDRKYYADSFKCCPPPYFILLVTIIEIACFLYHTITNTNSNSSVPIDSMFIYRPDKKHEIWRFVLYMLLHAGWFHLTFNLIMQVVIGIPLEMVHGSSRIACIYLAGVLAGSLGTSIFDSSVYLVGASGGVYALLAAHLANIMLNYNNMEYGIIRLLAILLFGKYLICWFKIQSIKLIYNLIFSFMWCRLCNIFSLWKWTIFKCTISIICCSFDWSYGWPYHWTYCPQKLWTKASRAIALVGCLRNLLSMHNLCNCLQHH